MTENPENPVIIGFVSLGCPKAIIDSETMLGKIAQTGFVITGETDNVDAVVVNTCGFIESAKQEALETIKAIIENKKKGTVGKVIAAGCLAERMGKTMLQEIPQLDAVVSLSSRDKIADILINVLQSDKPESYISSQDEKTVSDDCARLGITPAHWAYLRISEGCDHKCSFCTIPKIRGRFRSKPEENIIREVKELSSAGVKELNIVAQDTAYYGRDFGIKNGLSKIIRKIDNIDELELEWIRLMYLYPVGISDNLLDTIAQSRKILPYFDMPIQHINDDILKAMRRPDRKQLITNLINKIRHKFKQSVIRTTVIVGFPGETDEQFKELLEFVKKVRFDALGCFTYFPESGTKAAHLPDQIDNKVKKYRMEQIMLCQQKIAFEKNRQRIGDIYQVLIESPPDENGTACGRYFGQAPEVDSVSLIENCTAVQGEFVDAKVISVDNYDLVLSQINS
jgi:ribosomal protein S12 methylthiotransferase